MYNGGMMSSVRALLIWGKNLGEVRVGQKTQLGIAVTVLCNTDSIVMGGSATVNPEDLAPKENA